MTVRINLTTDTGKSHAIVTILLLWLLLIFMDGICESITADVLIYETYSKEGDANFKVGKEELKLIKWYEDEYDKLKNFFV